VGGVSTGERGDRFLLDDPHNVIKAESDAPMSKKPFTPEQRERRRPPDRSPNGHDRTQDTP
jgi:hypothetical protein